MQKQKYFSRYGFIIQKLRISKEATFEEIKDYLERQSELADFDLNISKRTFDRDKNEILSLFNILIEYDFRRKVYYIKEEEQEELNNRMLESFHLFNSLKTSDKLAQHIIFEKRRPQGIEHFQTLLQAIKDRRMVHFIYTKFWDDDISVRTVEPYALKESQYRWYLLAKDKKDDMVKSFGLDRISDLDFKKTKFTFPTNININELFRHCYGVINIYDKDPVKVVLAFTPLQGKYIKSLPLHESQRVILENDNEIRIKLNIQITEDFLKELLSYGNQMKIISPKSLNNKVCKIFESALKNNKEISKTN